MGWEMPWYTHHEQLRQRLRASIEYHGHNVFFRDGDKMFRTLLRQLRGDEVMGTTWATHITPLRPSGNLEDSPEVTADRAVQVVELAR